MVLFNYSTKELTAKVVYYGPGLCGKTTNLQWVHEKLPIKNKGKMLSLATETDRTLFFDFLPIELGTIRGMRTRIQLYTVPGQVFYNATRRMVLKGADCVVFVCDSQEAMLDANVESLENMRANLEANEIDPEEIPTVLQYNKRDLPNALPIEILNERLNPRGVPFHEAVAVKGVGVEETLKGATGLVFRSLAARYGGAEGAAEVLARTPRPATPVPAPALEPEPEPRPAPRVGSPTLPPVNLPPPPPEADALLDSLELEPAQEEAAPLGEAIPSLEPTELGMEELELEEVAPRPAPPPAPSSARELDPPTSPGFRVEDLDGYPLQARPPDGAGSDAMEELDDAVLEPAASRSGGGTDPLPLAPPPVEASPFGDELSRLAPARAEAALGAGFEDDTGPSDVAAGIDTPDRPSDSAGPVAAGPAELAAVPVSAAIVTSAPVSVQLPPDTGLNGQADITIPVELSMGSGPAQINIHFRLTLNLRLK